VYCLSNFYIFVWTYMFRLFTQKISGFTLVEMLIVIVIIWLLAASLIPKIIWFQAKARDTARQWDIKNVATALSMYYMDNGEYPAWSGWLINISWDLQSYVKGTVPTDPQWARSFSWITENLITNWEYWYTRLRKWGINNGGFALMAGTEWQGWVSNRVSAENIINSSDINDLSLRFCKKIDEAGSTALGSGGVWTFTAVSNADVFRHLYLDS